MNRNMNDALGKVLGVAIFVITLVTYIYMSHLEEIATRFVASLPNVLIILAGPIGWAVLTWDIRQRDTTRWWRGVSQTVGYMGAVGASLGFMKVMTNLEQPELIGPGLGVAASTFAIGFILCFLVFIIAESKAKTIDAKAATQAILFPVVSYLTLTCTVLLILLVLKKECNLDELKNQCPDSEEEDDGPEELPGIPS